MSFDERLKNEEVDRLFSAMKTLSTLEEYYRFFEDLCTTAEIETMAQRFRVAELLEKGCTYEEIQKETGISSATISRIKRFLNYGADGYRLAIERLQHTDHSE